MVDAVYTMLNPSLEGVCDAESWLKKTDVCASVAACILDASKETVVMQHSGLLISIQIFMPVDFRGGKRRDELQANMKKTKERQYCGREEGDVRTVALLWNQR